MTALTTKSGFTRRTALLMGLAAPAIISSRAMANGKYDVGADDKEIRIGQTAPYSGPASYLGVTARAEAAYFDRLNKNGGISGRQIKFLSLDDAYSPPKTVEATRRLVESDNVLGLMGSIGTAPQVAVQKYLNAKKVPQLLVSSGASRFNQPKLFPWTTPNSGDFTVEGFVLGKYLLASKPDARIAVLHPVDELGRDYVKGLKSGLGDKAKQMIIVEETYETSSPTVDSQMLKLSASGANVFANASIGKFTSQSVRKAHELGWKPDQYVTSAAATVSLLKPAGSGATDGLMALRYMRSVSSPKWADDAAVKDYQALRAEYLPNVDPNDNTGFFGYSTAILMQKILEKCGDDLTRTNLLKVATDLRGMTAPINLPGITFATQPDDYAIYRAYELSRYENDDWTGIQPLNAD